jgi:catalase
VNYFPSNTAPKHTDPARENSAYPLSGEAMAKPISKTNDFAQAGIFYRSLSAEQRAHLIANLAGDLGQVTNRAVKTTMISYFYQADPGYGARLAKALAVPLAEVRAAVERPVVTALR